MSYREELVTLIANGTQPADIYLYFSRQRHLGRSSIMDLLKFSGITMPIPSSDDGITDERRRELQELSLSE